MIGNRKATKPAWLYRTVCCLVLWFQGIAAAAQMTAPATEETREVEEKWYQPKVDTAQVDLYDRTFGLTIFLQQKNIRQNYKSLQGKPHLSYEPNRGVDLGLGFIYRYIALSGTLNLVQHMPEETIKTTNIDFQSQILARRLVSFVYAQYYKGFFSALPGLRPTPGYDVYARPDMSLVFLGASTVFGLKKDFSFSGNISPVQWQKRSGGTPLLALDLFYGLSRGDSSLVPAALAAEYPYAGVWRSRTWNAGIGAGYAYTCVFKQHFFITGIASVKVPVNYTLRTHENGSTDQEWSTGVNIGLWGRMGYNSDRWNIALTATNSRNPSGGDFLNPAFVANTGYLRLGYTRRFSIGHQTRKKLKTVDRLLDIPYKLIEQIVP